MLGMGINGFFEGGSQNLKLKMIFYRSNRNQMGGEEGWVDVQ